MKVLFVNQYYWPDVAATSQMLTDLCEHLAQRGHDVEVLCSTGQYDNGTSTPGKPARRESHNGVNIRRVPATGFGKRSMLGRIVDYLSFHLVVGLRVLLTGRRHDVLVTLTTPPLIGIYATVVSRLSLGQVRHVCWVMDLHPDCEFALGLFNRDNPLALVLDWLNGLHFRQADRCVALGRHMARRLIDKRVDAEKITVIPVWGHDLANTDVAEAEAVSPDRFVVMYSGNAGLAHTFESICQAMLALKDDQRFAFVFAGGGRRMREIRSFVERHCLKNVRFEDYVPRLQLASWLAVGDVHLISLRPGLAGMAVPSKLYGVMAAGRPVAFAGPRSCETADAIAQADCGKTFDVDDADGLVDFLKALADDPVERRRLGANARSAFEQHYQRQTCCQQWMPVLEELAQDDPEHVDWPNRLPCR